MFSFEYDSLYLRSSEACASRERIDDADASALLTAKGASATILGARYPGFDGFGKYISAPPTNPCLRILF